MNGFVKFETTDGEPLIINVDRVSFVRRYRGEPAISAINFEKGSYIVVRGGLDEVMTTLADG